MIHCPQKEKGSLRENIKEIISEILTNYAEK